MIASSIFDHPAVLLLIGFVALVRWLISKAKSQTETTQTPTESPPPPPAQPIMRGGETRTEEERIRKFLEALGQPVGTRPPPKVTPRPPPVMPKIFPRLPPLKTVPPPLPPEPSTPVVVPPLPMQAVRPAAASSVEDYQVYEVARQTSSEPSPESRPPGVVRSAAQIKLGTPQDLRTAIILREIFGPPRSLQPIDLTSSL